MFSQFSMYPTFDRFVKFDKFDGLNYGKPRLCKLCKYALNPLFVKSNQTDGLSGVTLAMILRQLY